MPKIKNALLATLLAVSGIAVGTGTASAGIPSLSIGSGTLRAIFYENINFTGARLLYYGNGACTASTTDVNQAVTPLPAGWNDVISSVQDFNSCDVNLYRDINYKGAATGYLNYGTAGKNVSGIWNDQASSFRLS